MASSAWATESSTLGSVSERSKSSCSWGPDRKGKLTFLASGLFCPSCVARQPCAFHGEHHDNLEDMTREEGKKRGNELLGMLQAAPESPLPMPSVPIPEWRPRQAPGTWGTAAASQAAQDWWSAQQHASWLAQNTWARQMAYRTDSYAMRQMQAGLFAKGRHPFPEDSASSDESTDAGSSQAEIISVHDMADPWSAEMAAYSMAA